MLIRTKLQRPQLKEDLIHRRRLLERLNTGLDRKLILLSAQAGTGKTTLLAQWLAECSLSSAWLALDEHDNDLRVFVTYLTAALRSVIPHACPATEELLGAPALPPADYLAASLVNEIDDFPEPLAVVLDDYHLIADTHVHQFLAAVLAYQPRNLHLVIATRRDPPFPIARLRADRDITEIRLEHLRFDAAEIKMYLESHLGPGVAPETVAVLAERTEGWIVGLRLASLALRNRPDIAAFLASFQGTNRYVMEYLVDEVLSRQPQPLQDLLLRTSILERFCAPLCDAVIAAEMGDPAQDQERLSGAQRLAELERANLFLIRLDDQEEWFRYHPLFRELLHHRLRLELSAHTITALHAAAGAWFGEHGYTEEALEHLLAAGDLATAASLVGKQRYALMNEAQWQQLDYLLRRFPPEAVGHLPDLLMLQTWLLYQRGNWSELPAALQHVEEVLGTVPLTAETRNHLQGEISALHSLMAALGADAQASIAFAEQAIRFTSPDLWIVRTLARLCLAAALQMTGDLQAAYAAVYSGYNAETVQSDASKATLLVTACTIHWIAADLKGLQQVAEEARALSRQAKATQMRGWANHHLGCVAYHRNDLENAERHFAKVVQRPYQNYGDCYTYSVCGLALTYQAQDRPGEANALAHDAVKFMLHTGNNTLLPILEALEAELALRQGRIAVAHQWAARVKTPPPMIVQFRFFAPHFTLVRTCLSEHSAEARRRASALLTRMRDFCEATHNTHCLLETLAMQALLRHAQGEYAAALADLDRALTLAQPSGFIRSFVDLGSGMAAMLADIDTDEAERAHMIKQILGAFPPAMSLAQSYGRQPAVPRAEGADVPLAQPLTVREMDVLALLALGLSDKEIAKRLVISDYTVRTHIKHIFAKLDVHNRRRAVVRAEQLGILSSR